MKVDLKILWRYKKIKKMKVIINKILIISKKINLTQKGEIMMIETLVIMSTMVIVFKNCLDILSLRGKN